MNGIQGRDVSPASTLFKTQARGPRGHVRRVGLKASVFMVPIFALPLSPGHAAVILVSSVTELQTALDAANPGDIIEVANGTHVMAGDLTISQSGTVTELITIRAQNRGLAELTGSGRVVFSNVEYVVFEGFRLTMLIDLSGIGNPYMQGQIHLSDCRNVRFTRNHLELDESNPNSDGFWNWVAIEGSNSSDNRIDHNLMENKFREGNFVAVFGGGVGSDIPSLNVRIDNNHFRDFAYPGFDTNGYESVRAGENTDGSNDVGYFLTIEENLFERCDGEQAIISLKCSDNAVLRNTIIDCNGLINLRSGNRNVVAGNFVLSTDSQLRRGGVFIYGQDHRVYNNHFEGLNSDDFFAPIVVAHGTPAGDGCGAPGVGADCLPATNCEIVFNTWVNCRELLIGFDKPDRPLAPANTTFSNNIIYGNHQNLPLLTIFEAGGITFSGNIVFPTGGATTGTGGFGMSEFNVVDPELAVFLGFYHLSGAQSPAVDAAAGSFPSVTDDIEGQLRSAPDVGADEVSNDERLYGVLTAGNVGPEADLPLLSVGRWSLYR